MEKSFWHKRWEDKDTAFHRAETNPLLAKHFSKLGLEPASRVFVPLCGKTLDIHWLLAQGYSVAGAELSKLAVDQLFTELNLVPEILRESTVEHYHAANIDIFVGDIFDLTEELLGKVDAVYDRAALVALPEPMRARYTQHLMTITQQAPQLLICYDYDPSLLEGPPFSIIDEEVIQHYGNIYQLTLLESVPTQGGLKNQCALEKVWYLSRD